MKNDLASSVYNWLSGAGEKVAAIPSFLKLMATGEPVIDLKTGRETGRQIAGKPVEGFLPDLEKYSPGSTVGQAMVAPFAIPYQINKAIGQRNKIFGKMVEESKIGEVGRNIGKTAKGVGSEIKSYWDFLTGKKETPFPLPGTFPKGNLLQQSSQNVLRPFEPLNINSKELDKIGKKITKAGWGSLTPQEKGNFMSIGLAGMAGPSPLPLAGPSPLLAGPSPLPLAGPGPGASVLPEQFSMSQGGAPIAPWRQGFQKPVNIQAGPPPLAQGAATWKSLLNAMLATRPDLFMMFPMGTESLMGGISLDKRKKIKS